MKLIIASISEAVNYYPEDATYAIRIYGSNDNQLFKSIPLKSSPYYMQPEKYTFDDIWPKVAERGGILFNEGLAKLILDDFKEKGMNCNTLLVHCTMGKNRSPAVAIALNEIFDLGNDSDLLKKKYLGLNRYVYDVLKKVAKKHSF